MAAAEVDPRVGGGEAACLFIGRNADRRERREGGVDATGMSRPMQNGARGRRSLRVSEASAPAVAGTAQGARQAAALTFRRQACSSGSV
ncbi:hypothetical protein D3C72_766350 [compost metagenome]